MTEQTARRLEKLLLRLLAKLDPQTVEPKPSAASVASVTVEAGVVRDSGDTADLPSQLEHTMIKTPLGDKYRRVTTVKR